MRLMVIIIVIFSLFFISGFKFSPDAPKSQLWRNTYEKCYQACVQEIDADTRSKKHWCNMYCVHIADEAFYDMEKENEQCYQAMSK